jgi:hypothetical protein
MRFSNTQFVRAIPVVMALGLTMALALSVPRGVTANGGDEHRRGCSNATLRGDYGFTVEGQILAGPFPGLLRVVGLAHYDGDGEMSQVDFGTINGVPTGSDWRPGTGTYDINPDCTGTGQLNFTDGSPSLQLRLVVVDSGREIRSIVEGNATGSIHIKVR